MMRKYRFQISIVFITSVLMMAGGGGCGGGGSDTGGTSSTITSSSNSVLNVGTASDQTGFSVSAINGEGSFNSSVTFQVTPGTHSILLQSNIDGASDPAMTDTSVTLISPSGHAAVTGLSLKMGSGTVSFTGGTSLPSSTGSATQFSEALSKLTNCATAGDSQECRCSVGAGYAATNMIASVINPDPGTWQIQMMGTNSPRFTLGVVANGSRDLNNSDDERAIANQAYAKADIPLAAMIRGSARPRALVACSWWTHGSIQLACELTGVYSEDVFIDTLLAFGVVQPETIPADAVLILSIRLAYETYWSKGCDGLANDICGTFL